MNSRLVGAYGEQLAARYLRINKYRILAANFCTRVGEIDIVAEKKNVICFIEVKTRKEGGMFSPADAVDFHKQENVRGSAAAFMNKFKLESKMRFDIIEVILSDNDEVVSINHIENAF